MRMTASGYWMFWKQSKKSNPVCRQAGAGRRGKRYFGCAQAALEVEDYRTAITWAAQAALRERIGKMPLVNTLVV